MQVKNNYRWKSCPLCGSSCIRKINRANYGGSIRFSSQEIDLSDVPEIWTCDGCSSGFVQNIIPEAIAASIYSISQAGERWSRSPFNQQKTPEVVHAMSLVFRGKGRVLDVGCNTGEMLDFAREFGCETSGVEYSDISREVISKKGHGAYKSMNDASGEFDVITAFDLIEHLYDVPAFLDECHSKLTKGGRLVLLTGDVQSHSAKKAGANWWYAQYPEHIVFISRRYLNSLSKFEVLSFDETYASAHYKNTLPIWLAKHVKRLITNGRYNGLPSFGADHMLVTLRKM